MVLNSRIGRRLLTLGWPLVALLVLFLVGSQFSPCGVGSPLVSREEAPNTASGSDLTIVRANLALLITVALCGSALLLLLLHQVHASLFFMTLRTFDPSVIVLSVVRMWASFVYSRCTIAGDLRTLPEDILTLYILLIAACTVIVMESAEVSRRLKTSAVVLLTTWAYLVWYQGLVGSGNWDENDVVSFFWLAPMTPRNQYISASLVYAIALSKACWKLFWGYDFMFVTAAYTLQRDSIDKFLKELGLNSSTLSTQDWSNLLDKAGIHGPLQEASYAALASSESGKGKEAGKLRAAALSRALVEQFIEHPYLPPQHLLRLLCQTAVERVSGIGPIPKMVGVVLEQWQKVQTHQLGVSLYTRLLKEPTIAVLFAGSNVNAHIATFIGILSVAMGWFRESDFCKVSKEMEVIGARHVAYGVRATSLSLFVSALLAALEEQLGAALGESKKAWTFVWTQLIITPFLRGLSLAYGMTRCKAQKLVQDSFGTLRKLDGFSGTLCRSCQEFSPALFNRIVPSGSKDPAADWLAFVASLVQVCTSGVGGRRTSQLPQLRAVHLSDLLDLQQALLAAVQEVLRADTDHQAHTAAQVATAWAHVLQFELVERHLSTHFAHGSLPPECGSIEGSVSLERFQAIFHNHGISEKLLEGTHRALASSDGDMNMASFRSAVINQSLMQPFASLEEVMSELMTSSSPRSSRTAGSQLRGQAWVDVH